MENASKALIIAGAILLSILIISLGIMVFNNSRNTVNSADLSETEVQAFNGKFTSYLGTAVTANQVYTLCDTVQTSNQAEKTNQTQRYVVVNVIENASKNVKAATYGVTGKNVKDTDVKSKPIVRLPASNTYTVTVTTDGGSTSGYDGSLISTISVMAN